MRRLSVELAYSYMHEVSLDLAGIRPTRRRSDRPFLELLSCSPYALPALPAARVAESCLCSAASPHI